MGVEIDIDHVARLARLDLTEDEKAGYRDQLQVILEHAARVQALESEPSHESAHPLDLVNSFRDDQVKPSLDRDEVLQQAPDHRDGYFAVPPALET